MDKGDQGVIEGLEGSRLTPLMFSFAQIRGTHPKNKEFTDAKCLVMAGSRAAPSSLDAIASKYMKHPLVKQMVERERAAQGRRFVLHGDSLVADAVTVKDMAMGRLPMIASDYDDAGELVVRSVYGVNLPAAKSALELLMRHKGMLKDKQELTGADGGKLFAEPRRVVFVSADSGDGENEG